MHSFNDRDNHIDAAALSFCRERNSLFSLFAESYKAARKRCQPVIKIDGRAEVGPETIFLGAIHKGSACDTNGVNFSLANKPICNI
jgi:hypothetical protein